MSDNSVYYSSRRRHTRYWRDWSSDVCSSDLFVNTLLSAEADVVCGAAYGQSSPERVNQRNGYRHRDFDTRAGTLDVAIPKLRQGSYFPEWLLERRRSEEHTSELQSRQYLVCPLMLEK